MDKTYFLGYSYEIAEEANKRFCFTVRNSTGYICDGGYSTTEKGAITKARRMIRLFASF